MYPLQMPARNNIQDYADCIAGLTVYGRNMLNGVRAQVNAAYTKYADVASDAAQLPPIVAHDNIKRRWRDNYLQTRAGGRLSAMRAELMAATRNDRCPLCGVHPAATLDHHLPKSKYPEFSILALNLVPACDPCNRSKGHKVGVAPEAQLLHSYFHHLPDEEVLVARVSLNGGVVVRHEIVQTANLDVATHSRALFHFQRLKLAQAYRKATNQELGDRVPALKLIYGPDGDANGVRNYLQIEAESARQSRGLNDWKTALLLALSRHNDFCNGGFELI